MNICVYVYMYVYVCRCFHALFDKTKEVEVVY